MNKKIVSADNKNYAIIGTRLDTPFPNNHALIVNDKIIWKFKYYESENCFTFNPNREVFIVRDKKKYYKVDIISDREHTSPCWNCPFCDAIVHLRQDKSVEKEEDDVKSNH